MPRFWSPSLLLSIACAGSLISGTASPAGAVTIAMTGVVHTDCSATVSRAVVNADGREIDLGLLARRCNDGEGYKVVLHMPEGFGGAVLVLQDRRVPLSGSGQTVVIDSETAEQSITQSAHILLPTAMTPGEVAIRLETMPKGPIY